MSDSPNLDANGPVSVSLLSNGQDIPDNVQIVSIDIGTPLGEKSIARLVVQDGGETLLDGFPISDSPLFNLGNPLEIRAGYSSGDTRIFLGAIAKHAVVVTAEGLQQLNIECEGERLAEPSETGPYLNVTLGDDIMEFTGEISARETPDGTKLPDQEARGFVRFMGSAKAQPGTLITLNGIGKRLNGNALIRNVQHLITPGDWVTKVTFSKHPNF